MPLPANNPSSDAILIILIAVAVVLMVAGVMAVWFVSWLRRAAWPTMPRGLVHTLTIAGLATTILGLYLLVPLLTGGYCLIIWPVLTLVLLSSAVQFVRSEARALVSMLAVAAQRGIPLTPVAWAFAGERSGLVAARAARLADYLNAGVPLSLALRRSSTMLGLFPAELILAADVGTRTGTLGTSLNKALKQLDDLDDVRSSVWAKLLYIGGIVLFEIGILTFVMIKIVPTFEQIFADLGIELPRATQLLMTAAHAIVSYWYVGMPLLFVIGVIAQVSMLSYVGIPMRALPMFQRFYAPLDNGVVMWMLALTTRASKSVVDGLHLLAGYFPLAGPRQRLDHAASRTLQGIPWHEAMRASRLINRREAAVLRSAERVGNVPWALDALGKSKIRRWTARVRGVSSILFPLLVVAVGAGVMFVVVSLMLPLIHLISGLS